MNTLPPEGQQPLIAFFLQPYPGHLAPDHGTEQSEYCPEARLNLSPDGVPLHLARTSSPPTSCHTPGHTIPAGYTPSGKWKSATVVPGKTDKRAGK
jgi:hypothetical protein